MEVPTGRANSPVSEVRAEEGQMRRKSKGLSLVCWILGYYAAESSQKPSMWWNGRHSSWDLSSPVVQISQEMEAWSPALWVRLTCLTSQDWKSRHKNVLQFTAFYSKHLPFHSLKGIFIRSLGSDETLIYRTHEELLEYAFEAGYLGVKVVSCWDTCWQNNSCTAAQKWIF